MGTRAPLSERADSVDRYSPLSALRIHGDNRFRLVSECLDILRRACQPYRDKNTRGSESDALETVKVMMGAGLDLTQTNAIGENALHGAALRGADTVALLKKLGGKEGPGPRGARPPAAP
jgi:hypothetical protein